MREIRKGPGRAAFYGLLLATTALAAPAFAQDPGATVDEVIVTAQKRAERLQDVPLAVSAVSADTLARRQINDTNNLVQAIPSLSFQQGANPANTSFRIRGIGTSLFGQGLEASVSLVVDGVVAARQSQNFSDLADIERVEVLRGPQGTLFGKNATAGVINIVTARPSFEFGGKASATITEDGEYRVSGSVTGPITDNLAGRLSAYYNDVRGNIRNVATGDWENGSKSWGFRGKLEWRPTENLSLLGSAEYWQSNSDCCQTVSIYSQAPARARLLAPSISGPENREVNNDSLGFTYAQQTTYSLEADLDLGWASLTSITAYQNYKQDANNEVDSIVSILPVYVGATGGNNYSQFNLNGGLIHLDQFSQEVRLTSKSGERLTYVVGAYYSYVELDRPFIRRRAYCAAGTAAQLGTPCAPTRWESLGAYSFLQQSHIAAFGQAEYELVDHLKLMGGLRVQRERISVEGYRYGPLVEGDALFGSNVTANAGTNASDNAVTGKVGLQYEFSRDAQVYATYTRGYKGQGLSTEVEADFANQKPILAEDVNAYELGFKGQTPDRRFSVAAALFLADYTNLQVQANRSDATTGTIKFVQTNAGKSETKGFELESILNFTNNFSVNAAFTYSKATIDIDGLNCPLQEQAAAPIIPIGGAATINTCYREQTRNAAGAIVTSAPLQDVQGGRLPASPLWRVNVSPNYRFDLGREWEGNVQLNVSYQSSQMFAVEQDPLTAQKGYTLVDASLSFNRMDDRYRVTFFAKNLFDQNYYTSVVHAGLLSSVTHPNDLVAFVPKNADRYFGVTLDRRF